MPRLRPVAALALAALGLIAAACGGGTATVTERSATTVRVTVRADGTPYHPVQDIAWPSGTPWSPGGARHIVEGLAAAVGHMPRVTYIALYDDYAIFTVLDDRDPRRSDNWVWRDGKWSTSALGNEDPADLREEAFTPDPASYAVVDQLVARSPALASDLEEASLVLISLRRERSRDDRLTWSVSINGSRDSATFRFELDGTLVRS